MERLTLMINHVLGSEPAATQRLQVHKGRVVRLEVTGWPLLLPPLPVLAFAITPAGLLEWQAEPGAPDLNVRLPADNPASVALGALSGELPPLEIDGDAQLAADVNWLIGNVRWDIAADLERVFGPVVAHQLHGLGSALAKGLRSALQGAGELAGRLRPR